MAHTCSVEDAVQSKAAHFRAAEVEFEGQLIRVYGKRRAPDARYRLHHVDKAVQHARDAFVRASDTWRSAVRQAREHVAIAEHCDG
jgi:putative DNA primase/helicase